MTPFMKAHKIANTHFQSVSILQTKQKFTSITKELLPENGAYHEIPLHGSLFLSIQANLSICIQNMRAKNATYLHISNIYQLEMHIPNMLPTFVTC